MFEVVIAPDPRLRVKTKPVKKITPALAGPTTQMIKLTQTYKDPEGVGLASTQIGLKERFFVGKIGLIKKAGLPGFNVFINPQITFYSKRQKKYFEGCLSIPNLYGQLNRSIMIKVTYQNLSGQIIFQTLKGQNAWIFQHEVDHLNGILFVDKVLGQKGRFFNYTGQDKRGEDIYEEIVL